MQLKMRSVHTHTSTFPNNVCSKLSTRKNRMPSFRIYFNFKLFRVELKRHSNTIKGVNYVLVSVVKYSYDMLNNSMRSGVCHSLSVLHMHTDVPCRILINSVIKYPHFMAKWQNLLKQGVNTYTRQFAIANRDKK